MTRAGLEFEVVLSPAEEIHDPSLPPARLCEGNAVLKASAVARMHPQATVIGADTLVFLDAEVFGKPADLEAARAMLRCLSGRVHTVCTGVCVIRPEGEILMFHELSEVLFKVLDDAAINAYFTLVNPLDKAGAYGIQEHGEHVVAEIRGNFDNVMGLPVARLIQCLGSA